MHQIQQVINFGRADGNQWELLAVYGSALIISNTEECCDKFVIRYQVRYANIIQIVSFVQGPDCPDILTHPNTAILSKSINLIYHTIRDVLTSFGHALRATKGKTVPSATNVRCT